MDSGNYMNDSMIFGRGSLGGLDAAMGADEDLNARERPKVAYNCGGKSIHSMS